MRAFDIIDDVEQLSGWMRKVFAFLELGGCQHPLPLPSSDSKLTRSYLTVKLPEVHCKAGRLNQNWGKTAAAILQTARGPSAFITREEIETATHYDKALYSKLQQLVQERM